MSVTVTVPRKDLPYEIESAITVGDVWKGPVVTLVGTDLSGATTKCEIRTGPTEDHALVKTATMVDDLANGKTQPTLAAADTDLRAYTRLYYSVQITLAGEPVNYVAGPIAIKRSPTE